MLVCPACSSKEFWKNGFNKEINEQMYMCKRCRKQFHSRAASGFLRMRYPEKVITYALKLFYRYRLSTREVIELLADRGVAVSHVAIFKWIQKYGKLFAGLSRRGKPRYTKIWHIDETFTRCAGRRGYLFEVIDSKRNILALYLSERRDRRSAERAIKLAIVEAGFKPDIIVSDGYHAYDRAVRKCGRKAAHVRAHFEGKWIAHKGHGAVMLSNNLLERWNSTFKQKYHSMRGFKSFECANTFLQGYRFFYNCLRPHSGLGGLTPARASGNKLQISWSNLHKFL